MSRLLAIETSGARGSVAVGVAGEVLEESIEGPREQTARILPVTERLLATAGLEVGALDAVVFGRGPGSFTGLRVAAAIAQGLALAADLPIVAVSSLAGLARLAAEVDRVPNALVCVDARMGEVYWAAYRGEKDLPSLLGVEAIGPPQAVAMPEGGPWAAVGDAFAVYASALEPVTARASGVFATRIARARDLLPFAERDLAAGRILAPEQALPVYLRDASAWKR